MVLSTPISIVFSKYCGGHFDNMSNVPGLVGIHCPCGRGDLPPRPTTVQGSDKPDKRKVFYHAIFNDVIKTIHSLEELPNSWNHVSVKSRYASWGKTRMAIKERQISRKVSVEQTIALL